MRSSFWTVASSWWGCFRVQLHLVLSPAGRRSDTLRSGDLFNGVSCKRLCVNGFPNLIIGLFDLNLEDLLICWLLVSNSFVFGISFISIFIWYSLPVLSTIVVVVGFSVMVSMACSSCCSFMLSTCSFKLFAPGDLGSRFLTSFGLSRPIGVVGVRSKLSSICSADVSLTGVLSLSSSSDWVSSSSMSSVSSEGRDIWINRPSIPLLFSPRRESGFWNEFGRGLLTSFPCNILLVSVVIVRFVPATAVHCSDWYWLSNLFLFCFFSKNTWKLVTNVAFELSWCLHD